jgi:hypothetical protein
MVTLSDSEEEAGNSESDDNSRSRAVDVPVLKFESMEKKSGH